MNFDYLREANIVRQSEWGGSDKATVEFRALEVGGETGELLEAVKKLTRKRLGIVGSTASLDDVADEAGDVVIAVDLLCHKLGIDLGEAVRQKFNKTSRKYKLKTRLV